MKSNRHQLEIAADRILQAQGSLAKTLSVLNKFGLQREAAYIAAALGELTAAAIAAKNAVPNAAPCGEVDCSNVTAASFQAGAATFARKVEAAPAAEAPAADVIPAEAAA